MSEGSDEATKRRSDEGMNSPTFVRRLSDVCPTFVRRLSDVCPTFIRRCPDVFLTFVRRLSDVCPTFVRRMSTFSFLILAGLGLLTCAMPVANVQMSKSPNVQTESLDGDVSGPHTETTGVAAAAVAVEVENLDATGIDAENVTGFDNRGGTVGGEGDSIIAWILGGGLTLVAVVAVAAPAGGLFYEKVLRPRRLRREEADKLRRAAKIAGGESRTVLGERETT
jgi:hypothetical protein